MQTRHFPLIVLLALATFFATCALAQAIDYDDYDHDGDGLITDEEYHATPGAQPWDGDLDDDGYYSQEEITALDELAALKQSDREQGGSAGHLSDLDVNFDGRLSYEEFQVGFPNVGVNPDTNNDGHIELSELEAVKESGPGRGRSEGSRFASTDGHTSATTSMGRSAGMDGEGRSGQSGPHGQRSDRGAGGRR